MGRRAARGDSAPGKRRVRNKPRRRRHAALNTADGRYYVDRGVAGPGNDKAEIYDPGVIR